MGTNRVRDHRDRTDREATARNIADDADALGQMLERGMFDDGPPRIGAEQELLLVNRQLCPAPVVEPLLRELGDARFTSELALFNLEANLTPRLLAGRSLGALEHELTELCTKARDAARSLETEILLSGYLPTFDPSAAHLGQMFPSPRFAAINRATMEARGGNVQLFIRGRDVLELCHDNIMLEGGATSFQVHLQVTPRSFAAAYNCAVLMAAPLLAACANSPLVFSHRLWHESRVPLLEASADLRTTAQHRRPGASRASLGDGWVRESPLEIYRRDLCRFEPVVGISTERSSTEELRGGGVPPLRALTAFNGTVWRWVRPCYGVTEGKPHLRIENRVLPAGPTILDEVANAALWIGLMMAVPSQLGGEPPIEFNVADENFHAAARLGLSAELVWLDGRRVRARDLLEEELLPLARKGLQAAGVADADRYLDIVADRIESGRTGAQWTFEAFDALPQELRARRKSWRIADMLSRLCWSDEPVHRWPRTLPPPRDRIPPVSALLRTAFVAVQPDASALLTTKRLEWSGASDAVVESPSGEFVGLLSAEDVRKRRSPRHAVALTPEMRADDAAAALRKSAQRVGVVLTGRRAAGIVLLEDLDAALGHPAGMIDAAC